MMLKKENPKSKMRTKLLKTISEMDLSPNIQLELSRKMKGLTDEQKEETASQMLTILTSDKPLSKRLKELQNL